MKNLLKLWAFCLFCFSASSSFALNTAKNTDGSVDYAAVVQQIFQQGDAAVAAYLPEKGEESADKFSGLYFDLFEGQGLENAIALKSASTKTTIESLFGTLIGQASQGVSQIKLKASWQKLKTQLQASAQYYQPIQMDSASVFIQSLLILLREGFEALLVITALAAYIRRQEIPGGNRVVAYSTGLAFVASLLTAWLMVSLLEKAGPAREALEGMTMLIATLVLLYVSGWLFSKREASRWQQYIRSKVDGSVKRGSLWALGFAIFLAVYREGAETVLFYQALYAQATTELPALMGGLISALALLVGLYWVLTRLSFKIPMGLFFSGTALLIFVLAFVFAGNGVLELQNAGWISLTPLNHWPRISSLGIHPSMETWVAQCMVLLIPLLVWLKTRKPTAQPIAVANREEAL
jgi:high-affinity iron transporter